MNPRSLLSALPKLLKRYVIDFITNLICINSCIFCYIILNADIMQSAIVIYQRMKFKSIACICIYYPKNTLI